jgi:hypothetical protein
MSDSGHDYSIDSQSSPISADQVDDAQQIAASANEQLDSYSLGNASRALNLSCSVMAVPGLLIIIVVFFLSGFNWVMTAIALTLVGMMAFLLANLASSLARNRSVEKYYAQHIHGEIARKLEEAGISETQFIKVAIGFLPINAPLKQMLENPGTGARKE